MINKSMLSRPQKLTFPYGWCGHIPFVSWLVETMRPATIVELGTHSGNSYFAICQAVLENGTGSKCYAVDTWQGDEHAGSYSENVFNEVNAWNRQYFAAFSNLLRMTFDQANQYFSESSVNLLHIDGLHTYEAVKHDFESWQPKLADDAIVIFHDTNVHERDFGVWQLWDELKDKYPSFEFLHSHGLGVLFVGEKSHSLFDRLNSLGEPALIRSTFSRLGELITLREEAHNQIQHIQNESYNHISMLEAAKQTLEKANVQLQTQIQELSSDNELYIKRIQDDKHVRDMLSGHVQALETGYHSKNGRVYELENEINRILNTRSWKVTKPLRFVFRVLRGQQKDTILQLKCEARKVAKKLYYKAPHKHREKLLSVAFKVRPSWFTSHPQFLSSKALAISEFEDNEKLVLIDSLSDKINIQPGNIAVHCHIFYSDLIDEFYDQLNKMPFKFDVYVSVTSKEAKERCELAFKRIINVGIVDVRVVPNRGRDIAPIFAEFGNNLKRYDYFCHIQTKKSLYNEGKTSGWREYLINGLFGSQDNLKRIFKAFVDNPSLGIIYPQAYCMVPYLAFSWLANRQQGEELCARMGIACPEGYFNFPAGSMFWARQEALAPLFNLNLGWNDFPEESGQTDGTTAHAIERLLGVVPQALNYGALIIKDTEVESNSTFRWDLQYFPRSIDSIKHQISDKHKKVIAFDIFDTLLVRPLLHPDHTKKIIAEQLSDKEAELYLKTRHPAESSARNRAGRDIGMNEIYSELIEYFDVSEELANKFREIEEQVEIASVSARVDMLDIYEFAKAIDKKIIIVSDMFLSVDTLETMLTRNGFSGWDRLYVSSAEGKRKDTGELYAQLLSDYGISGEEMIMFGDNERSDIQLPFDRFNIPSTHIIRATDLALHIPEYSRLAKKAYHADLNRELTFGLILRKNLNRAGDFSVDNLKLYSSNAYQIGYNLAGPLLASFSEWLRTTAKQSNICDLYFLAREGKIIKDAYDKWCHGAPDYAHSHYLILSRRAVNVPNVSSLDDVLNIAKSTFFANTLEMFLRERYGLVLNHEKLNQIYARGYWNKGKLVEIQNEDVSEIKPLLEFIMTDILNESEAEKEGLLKYLSEESFLNSAHKAVVDVGYSGTIQKALIKIVEDRVDGLYMATSESVNKGLSKNSKAYGCFIEGANPVHSDDSLLLRQSFELEKLLSSNDTQIVKYDIDDSGQLSPVFKKQRPEELLTKEMRLELQRGCLDFIEDASEIRNNLYPKFKPSLSLADSLYSEFIFSCNKRENDFVKKMTLDDDYCGRGLVN